MCHLSVQIAETSRPRHRGVAMLLVMVSLVAATIMTTAYLASRDNSPAIGDNGAATAAARWAAESGLELGVAILQNDVDWRAHAVSNTSALARNLTIGNATVDIYVSQFGTGAMVNANTEYIRITSMAQVNGVTQMVTANAFVPLDPGIVADVDLSEFAVFATSSLSMSNQAVITRWPRATLSELGRRIAIGTRATSANSITLSNAAAAIDATVYHGPGASGSLISESDGPGLEKVALLDHVPFPAPPPHSELEPLLPMADLLMSGGTATITSSERYHDAELRSNATRTLRGGISLVTDNDLYIHSGAKLIIDGQVKIVVFGNLIIDGGSIELRSGARLRLYVRGGNGSTAVSIRDGFIGELRTTSVRDNSGNAVWLDPQRITLFSVAPVSGTYNWQMDRNSVVKGSLYAPHAGTVSIAGTSALYGRIAANAVAMRDDAALFYDPALDIRCGYTNPESPIFDSDGRIRAAFASLTSLDAALLQLTADLTKTIIKSDAGIRLTSTATTLDSPIVDAAPPTEPTPRPIKVEYTLVSFGNNVRAWE